LLLGLLFHYSTFVERMEMGYFSGRLTAQNRDESARANPVMT
jgi:hypothetical protein